MSRRASVSPAKSRGGSSPAKVRSTSATRHSTRLSGRTRAVDDAAKPSARTPEKQPERAVSQKGWWPNGLGGISSKGVFDAPADWIDLSLPPAYTSQTNELNLRTTLLRVATGAHFFYTPNLVWFLITASMHYFCPYDLDAAARGWGAALALQRFALNLGVAAVYYGYFYTGLYWRFLSKRKFQPGVFPTAANMRHNLWYWGLGIVQWTAWELVMMRLWATGAVPYTTDAQLFASRRTLAINALLVLGVPVWRDVHFYIAHRFIHVRAIYKYVHSLHHRNPDPEPFSGLCMHPIEHLYYYSNVWFPTLYMNAHPIVFLFTFIHLTLAPGAGHSGWEDHFQSDQYHFLHHAKFECNYGSPFSGCIDQLCGTFRESLGDSAHYAGAWSERAVKASKNSESAPIRGKGIWSEHGHLGLPADVWHALYTLFYAALAALAAWGAVFNRGAGRVEEVRGVPIGTAIGLAVAYAPIGVALLLARLSGDRLSWRWPFHKDRLLGSLGVFLFAGWAACVHTTYHATKWVCD